jgi:hypothetical protein
VNFAPAKDGICGNGRLFRPPPTVGCALVFLIRRDQHPSPRSTPLAQPISSRAACGRFDFVAAGSVAPENTCLAGYCLPRWFIGPSATAPLLLAPLLTARRMAVVGASRSFPPVSAKVASPSRQRPPGLGGRNWSSCPRFAVGMPIAGHPPHRSGQARFGHPALTSGV